MRFSRKLYISPSLDKKCGKVKWKLRTGRPQPAIYVIALARNNDLLEIYHSAMLRQKYYKKRRMPHILSGSLWGMAEQSIWLWKSYRMFCVRQELTT